MRVGRKELHKSKDGQASLEGWLRREVAPAYDAHKADPVKALSLTEAWARFEPRMDKIDRQLVDKKAED